MRMRIGRLRRLIENAMRMPSPAEVLTTWEDLYINSLRNRRKGDLPGITPGEVSLEELTSWLGVDQDAVEHAASKAGLIVTRDGYVVARGHTPEPFKPAKN